MPSPQPGACHATFTTFGHMRDDGSVACHNGDWLARGGQAVTCRGRRIVPCRVLTTLVYAVVLWLDLLPSDDCNACR